MERYRQRLSSGRESSRTDFTGLALLLLATSSITNGFVSKVIDGRRPVTTSSGTVQFVSNSHWAGYIGAALLLLAAIAAVLSIARRGLAFDDHTAFSLLVSLALAWWLLSALVLRRDDVDRADAPFDLATAIVILSVLISPMQLRTLGAFNALRDLTAAAMLLTSFLDPTSSQIACRPDKCGIFGSLFTGFYYTENSAAQLVLLLLPAAIATRSKLRLAGSLGLAGIFILSTGSRTSLVGFLLAGIFILLHRGFDSGTREQRRTTRLWATLPILSLIASGLVFSSFSGPELTGRGYIYSGIRSQLHGYALIIGSGPGTMQRVFDANLLGDFEAIGEHGEVSHLLVESGIVGLALVALGLLALPLSRRPWSPGQLAAVGFALTASLQFVTEPGWTLDSRALNLVSLLLAVSLFRRVRLAPASSPTPQLSDDPREVNRRSQSHPMPGT